MRPSIKILLTVFIAVLLYSCSKDSVVNTIIPSGPFTLSGTIENWQKGGNIKLKAELFDSTYYMPVLVLDSTLVSANGAFTLKLKNAPDSLLYPITFYPDTSCVINVTVNPANTKSNFNPNLTSVGGLDLYNDSGSIGFIYRSNYGPDTIFVTGWYFTYYLYLNQNVSITGSVICNHDPYYDTTIYNFSGAKGWNKVVFFVNSYTQFTAKATISATEPAGGKWRAYPPYPGDALSDKSSLRQRIFGLNNNCIFCK